METLGVPLAKLAKDAIGHELTVEEMNAIADINKIRGNLAFMKELLEKDTAPSDSNLLIRPNVGEWSVYHVYELNHAKAIFTGTREECDRVKELILKQVSERRLAEWKRKLS